MTEDVIIIGGGPAGLSAAIYTARAGLNPLVIAGSPPGGQLTLTTEVENYPGYESIMGPELVDKMRKHALKFGVRIVDQNVIKVEFANKSNKANESNKTNGQHSANKTHLTYVTNKTYESNSVIITTGAKALWLNIPSETRLRGKGVSACATCDGFFFKGKPVAVIGGGDTALEEALTLTKFAEKVYIIHRRHEFRASKIMQERVFSNKKIEIIWDSSVDEITGENRVNGVKLSSKAQYLKVDGVFIAIGHKPDTDIFKENIVLDKKGYIVTSANAALAFAKGEEINKENYDFTYQTMTSVPGVFAGGDCVDHVYRQAATSVGMGVAAALDAEKYLIEA